jgi:hypothetical protein
VSALRSTRAKARTGRDGWLPAGARAETLAELLARLRSSEEGLTTREA